jgi:hypothetical protein
VRLRISKREERQKGWIAGEYEEEEDCNFRLTACLNCKTCTIAFNIVALFSLDLEEYFFSETVLYAPLQRLVGFRSSGGWSSEMARKFDYVWSIGVLETRQVETVIW